MALTLIATATVGAGGTSTVSFTSIPQTYKALYVVYNAAGTNGGGVDNTALRLNVNNDTSISGVGIYTNGGTTVTAYSGYIRGGINGTNSSLNYSPFEALIINYTSGYVPIFTQGGFTNTSNTINSSWLVAGYYFGGSAVSTLYLVDVTASFWTNSKFYLYGIN